jgi:hypothetical protein
LLDKNTIFKPYIDLISKTTLFDFVPYVLNGTPDHIPKPDEVFLQWFIGFFEAEGSFIQWKDNGKQRFQITIDQKDPALMYKIRTRLGFGNVTTVFKKSKTYWRYQVGSRIHLNRLILLFNGNLITLKKQEQFKLWVELKNQTYQTNCGIIQRGLIVSLQTAWLSGFLEGDGGFWASSQHVTYKLKDGTLSYSVRMKFYITQKGELELLNTIKTLLQIPSPIYHISNGHTSYSYNRLESSLLSCHEQVISYLNSILLGQRNILIQRWSRLIGYRTEKYPITEKS